jgi:hypothetical protein
MPPAQAGNKHKHEQGKVSLSLNARERERERERGRERERERHLWQDCFVLHPYILHNLRVVVEVSGVLHPSM